MAYINNLIGKYIPQKPITLAGTPKIHAIYDGITSTLATDKASSIHLPEAFYDKKLREIIDRLAYEEEFGGYSENGEMRAVGIGALMGDVVEKMVLRAEHNERTSPDSTSTDGGSNTKGHVNQDETKLWLHGSHDSTLAAVMASLGADEQIKGELRWPPYGSVLAIELFRNTKAKESSLNPRSYQSSQSLIHQSHRPISRTPASELSDIQKSHLQSYYVRLQYNNRPLAIPGCKLPGNSLDGNGSFCTLAAFKDIVDQFTPPSWQKACIEKKDNGLPDKIEPAGYAI